MPATPHWNHVWSDTWGTSTPPESYYGFRDRNVLANYLAAVNERTKAELELGGTGASYDSVKLVAPVDHDLMKYVWDSSTSISGVISTLAASTFQIKAYNDGGSRASYMNSGIWTYLDPDTYFLLGDANLDDTHPGRIYDSKVQMMRLIDSFTSTDATSAPNGSRALFVGSSAISANAPFTGKIVLKTAGTWALDPARNTDPAAAGYGFPDLINTTLQSPGEFAPPNPHPQTTGLPNDAVANDYWLNKVRDLINVTVCAQINLFEFGLPAGSTFVEIVQHTNWGSSSGTEVSEAAAKAAAAADFNSHANVDTGYAGIGGFSPSSGPTGWTANYLSKSGDFYAAAVFRTSFTLVVHNAPSSFAMGFTFSIAGNGLNNDSSVSPAYGLTSFGDPVYDCYDVVNARYNGKVKTVVNGTVIGPTDWTSAQVGDHLTVPTPWPSLSGDGWVQTGYEWLFDNALQEAVALGRFDVEGGFAFTVDTT